MTYAQFITKLRADVGDFGKRRYETADGDGSTTLYNLKHPKVLESSMVIRISSVVQASSSYTIDADNGQVIFNSAPASGNGNVSFEYRSVNLLDADWLDIINQCLQHWLKKIWKEFVDESTLDTVADQVDYSTTSIATLILGILNLEYRLSSTGVWQDVKAETNVQFYRDLQKIHIRPAFTTSGYDLRVRGIRAFTQGSATSSTFEPDDRYHAAIRKLAQSMYMSRLAQLRLKEVGAVSKEDSFETTAELFRTARELKREAEEDMKKVRMPKPSLRIPNVRSGVNI